MTHHALQLAALTRIEATLDTFEEQTGSSMVMVRLSDLRLVADLADAKADAL